MMSEKMADAINEQINAEFYSAFLYLSMATKLEEMTLPGHANWMKVQYEEEVFHAMKFMNHMYERGERVVLKEIAAPPTEWEGPHAMWSAAYDHEVHVTGLINNLMRIAVDENDFASQQFLQWYIEEQVEEEDNTSTIRDKIAMVQGMAGGLYMLDQELAVRTFTPPAEGE
ncbi:MAG: ferritin [Thermoplasmata archaeon]|nr:MAG: ferritin [Thermoplasmata archaeon]